MKKNTKMKSFLSIAAVSAFMLVTLAGCGDGNGSTGTGDAVQALSLIHISEPTRH